MRNYLHGIALMQTFNEQPEVAAYLEGQRTVALYLLSVAYPELLDLEAKDGPERII